MVKRKSQAGFSLIEIVISLFIVGTITALYAASSSTLVLIRASKNQEIALRIASNQIETLRGTQYNSLPASGAFTDPLMSSLNSATGEITVTDFNAKTKQVTVLVNWAESTSPQPRTVRLTTLITQGGLGQ